MTTKVWYMNAETGAKITNWGTVVDGNDLALYTVHKVTQENDGTPRSSLAAVEGQTITAEQLTAWEAEQDSGALPSRLTNTDSYGKASSLTAANAGTVDATYGAEEQGVLGNIRTRVNEIEAALKKRGILS